MPPKAKPAKIKYTPLGIAMTPAAPYPWYAAFLGISLSAGEYLIVGGASSAAPNNATWAGHQMQIGCISGGVFDSAILYYCAEADERGDVVFSNQGGNVVSLFASKTTGCKVPYSGFGVNDNTTGFNPMVSDTPQQTNFSRGILIGVTGTNVTSMGDYRWLRNWTKGQKAEQVGRSTAEGYKIISAAEMSQAVIDNLAPGSYQTCHLGIEAAK